MKLTVWMTLLLFTSGCASWFDKTDEPQAKAPISRAAPKLAKKEPGALWSEDSRWNDLYSVAPSRLIGDTVSVRIGDALRTKIAQSMDRTGKAERELASKEQVRDETKALQATIKEVLPRSVFAIQVNESIRVGDREARFTLHGNIRERDIGSDETISSDSIFNLSVDPDTSPSVAMNDGAEKDKDAQGRESEGKK